MAENIVRYALLSALYNDDLVESVETALKEGWEPLGAPFVYLRDSKELGLQPKRELMQAMVMRGNGVKSQKGIAAQQIDW